MPAPFLDPQLIVQALDAGIPQSLGVMVVEIGDPDQARERRALLADASVLVLPQWTDVEGPTGLGNGRIIQETIGVIIQIRRASQDGGGKGRVQMRAVRSAVFEVLEGRQIDPLWSPGLYTGGRLLDLGDDPGLITRWLELYRYETPSYIRPR